MIYPFKLIFAVILIAALAFELCSCGNHYSPLDNYIDGQIQKSKDIAKHAKEVQQFIECRYEGRECPNYDNCKGHSMRDYQIDLHNDTVWVYDGQRLVERYVTNWKGQIDTILLNDND